MRYAIDIDGCMIDSHQYVLSELPKILVSKGLEVVPKNLDAYHVQDIFQCTEELEDVMWGNYYRQTKLRLHCARVIELLQSEGDYILILTSRMESRAVWSAKRLLDANDIKCDIEFSKCKGKVCRQYNIDYLIDDFEDNLQSAANYRVGQIVFDNPYNKDYKANLRVHDWIGFYDMANMLREVNRLHMKLNL